jgi:hypothetical protein
MLKKLLVFLGCVLLTAESVAAQRVAGPDPHATVRLEFDPPSLQEPRRQTRRGAVIGAVAGGIGGLGGGVFVSWICRIEGSSSCDWAIPAGGLLGVAAGAAAGAIIGAAIPTEARPAGEAAPRARRRIGSFGGAAGPAHVVMGDFSGGTRLEAGGIGARASLAAELRPWFALGPDAGIAFFGAGEQVRHIALEARFTMREGGVEPYIAGNLGAYQATAPSLEFLGGSVAAGGRLVRGGRYFDLSARYSRNAQNIEPLRMVSVQLGAGVYW